jgi:hypothetical protein
MQPSRERSAGTVSKVGPAGESRPRSAASPAKRSPKLRTSSAPKPLALATDTGSRGFPAKPLLVGAGIGAALALTAVALGSRSTRTHYFGPRPPTISGALTKTAAVLLVRVVARKALAAAARQGAEQLARAWPF